MITVFYFKKHNIILNQKKEKCLLSMVTLMINFCKIPSHSESFWPFKLTTMAVNCLTVPCIPHSSSQRHEQAHGVKKSKGKWSAPTELPCFEWPC